VPACGMDQRDCAVDPALGFKLTLDLDPVSGRKEEIGENLDALCGEIHEGALAGGSVAARKLSRLTGIRKWWRGSDMRCLLLSNNRPRPEC